ncbi:MAG: calcium-binding protein [Aliishimia sp.]
MPTEDDPTLVRLLDYVADNLLGLDQENPLASVDFDYDSDGGEVVATISLGSIAGKVADALKIDIDVSKTVDVFNVGEAISGQIDDVVQDIAGELRNLVGPSDRISAVILEPLIEDFLATKIVDDLSEVLTDAALDLELPQLGRLTDAFEDAFDIVSEDAFEKSVSSAVNFYATTGLAALSTAIQDNGVDEEYLAAVAAVGNGFLLPELNKLVDDILGIGDDYTFDKDGFLTSLETAVFDGLILDDIQDEVFDDILGLDGGSQLEDSLSKLLSDETRDLFVDTVDGVVDFLSGDVNALDFETIIGGFDVGSILSSIFTSFAADEIADLFVEIDSLGEGIASQLGTSIAAKSLGASIGGLLEGGLITLFGQGAASALGATFFQGVGTLLGGALGAIAGSLVFEAIDWISGGWFSGIIDQWFGGSPQGFRGVKFDPNASEDNFYVSNNWGDGFYNKDDDGGKILNSVSQLAGAYAERVNSILEFVDEGIEKYQNPSLMHFAWGVKHHDEKYRVFLGHNENATLILTSNAEAAVQTATQYTLSRLTFDTSSFRGKAYEAWKLDMAAEIGGSRYLTSKAAYAELEEYMRRADFIQAYLDDPIAFDEVLQDASSPAAIAFLKDYVWAFSKGLLDDVDFTSMSTASAEDAQYSATSGRSFEGELAGDAFGLDVLFSLVSQAEGGAVSIDPESGEFVFVPDEGFLGEFIFAYSVTRSDGRESTAEVSLRIEPKPPTDIVGTEADDTLGGGDNQDRILGRQGDDILWGYSDDDALLGQLGDDVLIGGLGSDVLNGGAGFDLASYKTASSDVRADLLNSATNTSDAAGDVYLGIEGLIGSGFDDTLRGDTSNNAIWGYDGWDVIVGRAGNDQLFGMNGNDFLSGSAGNDDMRGGNHADILQGGVGADHHDGGGGIDQARYLDALDGVIVDLAYEKNNTGFAKGDTFASIENVYGSKHGDGLRGDNAANFLWGHDGDDRLLGRGGGDSLYGMKGDDVLIGASGADRLFGGAGQDRLQGGQGSDIVDGGAGDDFAVYHGAKSDYAVLDNADGSYTVLGGADGGDTLRNVEYITFSNGTWEIANTLTLPPDAYEPNNTKQTAYDLTAFEGIALSESGLGLATYNELDWYKLTVPEGAQGLKVVISSGDTSDLWTFLYPENGHDLTSDWIREPGDAELVRESAEAGTYYFTVTGYEGPFTYDINWETGFASTDDAYEDNDTRREPFDLSSQDGVWLSQYAGVGVFSDGDHFEFETSADAVGVEFEVLLDADQSALNFQLYDVTNAAYVDTILSAQGDMSIANHHGEAGAVTYLVNVQGEYEDQVYDFMWRSLTNDDWHLL